MKPFWKGVCSGAVIVTTLWTGDHLLRENSDENPSQQLKTNTHALKDFSSRWEELYANGDFDALGDMYEADAWLMAQGQPARKGVEDIIAYLSALKDGGMTADIRTSVEDLVVDGNYAFSTTQWRFEHELETGERMRDAGRSFVVFKRGDDGKWRLWRAAKNQSPDVKFEDNFE